MFKLFILRNPETITLCLAAIQTLARKTIGIFKKEEVDEVLNYLQIETRAKVFRILQEYGWIDCNGITFEIPARVMDYIIAENDKLSF